MSTTVKTQSEIYEIYKNEVQALAPEFTDFSPGSLHDVIAGAVSMVSNEVMELIVSEFSKTYLDLADGADLDRLVVDHFGSTFARPAAVSATGEVTFSRPNISAGNVTIPAGTIVKTKKNSTTGEEQRFSTTEEALMTGLSVDIPVSAVTPGVAGNVQVSKVVVIESTLGDPSLSVTNALAMAGGQEAFTDAEYREFTRAKILALSGATESAVSGAARAVPGVGFTSLTTEERTVIDYDIAQDQILAGSSHFRIPYPVLYVADDNGNSSVALVEAVKTAIHPVRAAGVKVLVKGAVPKVMDWTASLTLDIDGPNYAELEEDLTKIIDTMKDYVNRLLPIGRGFNRAVANAYIMSVWGPSGTGDLTNFSSSVPTGNVSVDLNEKLITGNVEII